MRRAQIIINIAVPRESSDISIAKYLKCYGDGLDADMQTNLEIGSEESISDPMVLTTGFSVSRSNIVMDINTILISCGLALLQFDGTQRSKLKQHHMILSLPSTSSKEVFGKTFIDLLWISWVPCLRKA